MPDSFEVPVVYYHSVGPEIPNWTRNFLSITPGSFESHLLYFKNKYNVISVKERWQIQNGQLPPVKNPLIINFDDGYLDNWTWAFPLLKKYGFKATLFISPEFVDQRNFVRSVNDSPGFLSWDEMRLMEASGVFDIQSHTTTHTKYFVSEKLKDFHNPKADFLYPIGNIFPSEKPNYIADKNFQRLVPYGYPFFEEASSVIARKVDINPDFNHACVKLLQNHDFNNYRFADALKIITPLYNDYHQSGELIINCEGEKEYKTRLAYELVESKRIIEKNLNKIVEFLCWPHGDNNEVLHKMALEAGYLMTTKGKAEIVNEGDKTRIPERMGMNFSSARNRQKTIFKLKAFSGKFPFKQILNFSRKQDILVYQSKQRKQIR